MTEVEIKLLVTDPAAVRNWLRGQDWQPEPVANEINWVFETPQQALVSSGRLLRVRQVNERTWLTVKRPVAGADGRHKVREELEVEASDGPTLVRLLQALDYEVAWRYDKRRTAFHKAGSPGEILLDVTPIGTYLELEGPAEWIDATAAAMGFGPRDYITSSYRELFLSYKATHPGIGRDMVFPETP